MNQIQTIEGELLEFQLKLKNHELYTLLSEIDDIRVFMEKHVFAVWDFMSLLKALQIKLTCVSLPWKPVSNAKTARFINEIVFGEESDLNEEAIPKSHFEMYLAAMQEVKADSSRIMDLIHSIKDLEEIDLHLSNAPLKTAEKDFLAFTFDTIKSDELHKIASAFTFGREDIIPDLFIQIIKQSSEEGINNFPKLSYYLERHIELDGDEHGPLALEMISELCGDDEQKWIEVLDIAKAALLQRIYLWDEIASEIKAKKPAYNYA